MKKRRCIIAGLLAGILLAGCGSKAESASMAYNKAADMETQKHEEEQEWIL